MMNLYFNNAFSKQPAAEVVEGMIPFLREHYENPLTESPEADYVRGEIERSRNSIATLLDARGSEIYFVSSGTEANNWALKGAAYTSKKKKNHLILSSVEHFSVYQTAQFLQKDGFEVSLIPVSPEGFVDPHDVAKEIRASTILVSVQSASDEFGVIQNISQIASLKSDFSDVLFHTDAVQYLCYEDFSSRKLPFDLVSLSSNALYGPTGVAALFIREGSRVLPLLHGGMQEEGMRPGLQSIAAIAGFGIAAQMNVKNKKKWKEQLLSLQQQMFDAADSWNVSVTGSRSCRLADNIHWIVDVDGEALLTLLLSDGIRSSSGSTCYQFAQKESHVLKALGYSADAARGSMLFTLSKDHDAASVEYLLGSFKRALEHLRSLKC